MLPINSEGLQLEAANLVKKYRKNGIVSDDRLLGFALTILETVIVSLEVERMLENKFTLPRLNTIEEALGHDMKIIKKTVENMWYAYANEQSLDKVAGEAKIKLVITTRIWERYTTNLKKKGYKSP